MSTLLRRIPSFARQRVSRPYFQAGTKCAAATWLRYADETVTADQRSAVQALLAELRQLTADEQAARLAAVSDVSVRSEVASLLDPGFAATVTVTAGSAAAPAPILPREQRFGPYRVCASSEKAGRALFSKPFATMAVSSSAPPSKS